MFAVSHGSSYEVEVENTESSVRFSEARAEEDVEVANVRDTQVLVATLESKEPTVLFGLAYPGAARHEVVVM